MKGSLFGHYKILRRLGRGGMGEVWAAEDTKLNRQVALKVLPPEMAANPERVERFEREAKAVAGPDHPNIVTIYSVEEADGVHFITMQLVEGKTLAALTPRNGFPLEKVFDLAIPLADAISAAHQQGIVHRDLKPSNIMVSDDGSVKVLDFGLAKLVEKPLWDEAGSQLSTALHGHGPETLTEEGKILGTVTFMSPEQMEGKPVDHRTDIFSLGIIFYKMATGEHPFKGDSMASLMSAIIKDTPTPVSDVNRALPRHLGRIIKHALEKDPEHRFQSAKDLRNELGELRKEVEFATPLTGTSLAHPALRKPGKLSLALAGALLLLIGYFLVPRGENSEVPGVEPRPGVAAGRQRIAVLPLENLGPEEEEYFAAGITDEITSRLASISSLGVISRTSAMQYKENRPSTQQIGEELGVDYILEGTVRWARGEDANRVRITPQLVRVADDTQLWAQSYNFAIDDIFEVQSEIARTVVDRLGTTLLEPERRELDVRPTENLDAYQAYLQALYHARRQDYTEENWQLAVQAFERAVELDPDFALAHAELATAHSMMYFLWFDPSAERRAAAGRAARRAIDLAPETPDVHLALGYYHYMVEQDYEQALDEFAIAEKDRPGSSEILLARGYVLRRQGRWEEALDLLERALELNPRDALHAAELAETYETVRRYGEAIRYWDQSIALDPTQVYSYYSKAETYWLWNGTTQEARAVLEAMPESDDPLSALRWFWQEIYEGNYREAMARLSGSSGQLLEFSEGARPKSLVEARAYELLNEPQLARSSYDSARRLLETEVQRLPWDPRRHSALGIAYAGLGRKDDAIRAGKRALELFPISEDAYSGFTYVMELALIYTMVGDQDAALDQIESLLSIPGVISVPLLRLDPRWEPLRQNSRFQELVQSYW